MNDFDLLAAWRDGDARAGHRLFARHYDTVRRFFVTKASDELDDLVQKTFLVCIERPDGFQQRSNFRTFLLGVAYKVLLRYIRDKQRRLRRIDPATESIAALTTGAFTAFVRQREQEILLAALRRIPIEFQAVLELYYWERLPAGDCGRVLQIPEGTVRSRLRRARELLLAEIEQIPATEAERGRTCDNLEQWIEDIRVCVQSLPGNAASLPLPVR